MTVKMIKRLQYNTNATVDGRYGTTQRYSTLQTLQSQIKHRQIIQQFMNEILAWTMILTLTMEIFLIMSPFLKTLPQICNDPFI